MYSGCAYHAVYIIYSTFTFCVSAYLALGVVCRGEVTDLPQGLCMCLCVIVCVSEYRGSIHSEIINSG